MHQKGFTVIELVVVIIVLAILAITAFARFVDLKNEADLAVMTAMKTTLVTTEKLTAINISLHPEQLNSNQNRFTLDNGQTIRVRGKLPDGRWNNTFSRLVDFEDTAQVGSNNCTDESLKWCVRQRNAGWFVNRGYSTLGTGRGFVIFPQGNNVNQDRCYIYLLNQNDSVSPTTVQPTLIDIDLTEC